MSEGERKAILTVERGLHTLTYRWTANFASPAVVPPTAEVTGASEGVMLVAGPGEPFGVLSGPGKGLVVLAEVDGSIELTLRAGAPGGSCAAEIELKRVEAPRPAFAPELPKPSTRLPEGGVEFLVGAHVSLRGDVLAGRGAWICGPETPGRLEGVEIRPVDGNNVPLQYQVATGGRNGGWSTWVDAGTYAGSRGKATPIIGLRLRLKDSAAKGLVLQAEAAFLGSSIVSRAGREIELTGPSLLDPLVGLRIDLVPASQDAVDMPAQDNRPALPASSRPRVFRRTQQPSEAA